MCGIAGFILVKDSPLRNKRDVSVLMTILAVRNDKRGGQSWGMYTDTADIHKELGDAQEMDKPQLDAISESSVCLLHTRFATHGAKVKENSHPFRFGNIIGAHNGVLYNHEELNKQFNRDFVVDSMHLIKHIEEERASFSDIEGYGVTQHVDITKPDSVILTKFNGGSLTVFVVDGLGVFWSSLKADLKTAFNLVGYEYSEIEFKDGQVIEASVAGGKANCYLYGSIDVSKSSITTSWRDYSKSAAGYSAEAKKYKGYQHVNIHDEAYWSGDYSPSKNGKVDDDYGATDNGTAIAKLNRDIADDTILDLDDIDPDAPGSGFGSMTKDEMNFLSVDLGFPDDALEEISLNELNEMREQYGLAPEYDILGYSSEYADLDDDDYYGDGFAVAGYDTTERNDILAQARKMSVHI